jgi:D-3-phosphoglycerate dehydrogenase / 2-oxoglutarate reductase
MPKVIAYGKMVQDAYRVLDARPDIARVEVDLFDVDRLRAELSDAAGVLVRYAPFDADTVACGRQLKTIARTGVGVDAIDVKAATEHGIPVTIIGDINSRSVAEHTLALMLAVAKQLLPYDRATRGKSWEIRQSLAPIDLAGRRVLVVGFGRIGRRVARLCQAHEMSVSVFDPYVDDADVAGAGCTPVGDLDAALAEADCVTLHAPANEETAMLLDRQRLAALKPGAMVINTARGPLVDAQALAEALAEGRIYGAGIDVYAKEPPEDDHPLFAAERSVLTPHTSAMTRDCMIRTDEAAMRNVLDAIDGRLDPALVVNPEALKAG